MKDVANEISPQRTDFTRRRSAFVAAALLVILVIGLLGFKYTNTKLAVIEYNDVIGYKLEANPKTGLPEKVSGTIFASALCVRDTKVQKKDSRLTILVFIGSCMGGKSGGFTIPLKITDDVKEVRFGEKAKLLWSG